MARSSLASTSKWLVGSSDAMPMGLAVRSHPRPRVCCPPLPVLHSTTAAPFSSSRCNLRDYELEAMGDADFSKRAGKHGDHKADDSRSRLRMERQKQGRRRTFDEPRVVADFSPPERLPKTAILARLRENIGSFQKTTARRIIDYGIRGSSINLLLTAKAPQDRRVDGSALRQMEGLIDQWVGETGESVTTENAPRSEFWDMDNVWEAYDAEGEDALQRLCMGSFLQWLETNLETVPENGHVLCHLRLLLATADQRFPMQNYSQARSITREIHLHVGPTNSGKTHGALVALCKANTGVYAGPLRLLAHEVWERINSGTVSPGVPARPCNLSTGEEKRIVDKRAGLTACTVEMLNLEIPQDVAVIDEIQMIGDRQRGFAWTAAVLGIVAKELHLCGESSVVPLIKQLAESCGDNVHVHEYERLTPLKLGPPLKGKLDDVQRGDCIVAFSRNEIFRLKDEIEFRTDFKVALAYGALPPETKSEQAKLFNEPDNEYGVMVASDAIGMGLNLKIKRIIFSTVTKWNGHENVAISASQIKQIAGRAGRYGTSGDEEAGGVATTFQSADHKVLKDALAAPLLPITRASIQPSAMALAKIATMIPSKRQAKPTAGRLLSKLFDDLSLLARIDSRLFYAGTMEQQQNFAPIIEVVVPGAQIMTIYEKEKFANAPANLRDDRLVSLLANMVGFYCRGELIKFENVDSSLGMLKALKRIELMEKMLKAKGDVVDYQASNTLQIVREMKFNMEDLMILESLHRGLTLYQWLSFRFPVSFPYGADILNFKERTENSLDFALEASKAFRPQRRTPSGKIAKPKYGKTAHLRNLDRFPSRSSESQRMSEVDKMF